MVKARIDGLSHIEISRRFSISYRASLSRLYRARKKLIDRLKGLYSIFGLAGRLGHKWIILGGVAAVKIGTGAKVTIGVIGILIVGFTGFKIVTHQPDQEILSTYLKGENREKQEASGSIRGSSSETKSQEIEHTEKGQEKPSDKEVESFIDYLDNLDGKPGHEEPETEKVDMQAGNSETEENGKLAISPELEKLFTEYKEFLDRCKPSTEELGPLTVKVLELGNRASKLVEISVNSPDGEEREKLREEIRLLNSEISKINAERTRLLKLQDQLVDEFDQHLQTHYGMTYQEFQDLRTGPERETWIAWLNSKQ